MIQESYYQASSATATGTDSRVHYLLDQIPAIALTAYGLSEDRLRGLQEGFQVHVAKPVEPAEQAVVIASVTTRHAWERELKE
ncbi:MAG TPA: hypothetical protein VG324_12175 [Blastocatellia bacterium]|nr:hypothetical protein [Blastocatellia bacterium]